jgi:hypothetical protein
MDRVIASETRAGAGGNLDMISRMVANVGKRQAKPDQAYVIGAARLANSQLLTANCRRLAVLICYHFTP